jgi:glycosyltransferase involved in cell wall biosynthesis
MELRDSQIVLFFSKGISLEIWNHIGNIDREIKPYNLISEHCKKIQFITYGGTNDYAYKNKLRSNIDILIQKKSMPAVIYQFIIPFVYCKELRTSSLYKTNQMAAAIPAVVAKLLFRKKLLLRCGFEWLSVCENQGKAFYKKYLLYLIEKIAYYFADEIVVTSEKDRQFINRKFKGVENKITKIPNYIDVHLFAPLPTKKIEKKVLFIGRLEKEKNLINLIQAIADTKMHLVIIGNGSMKDTLKNYAEKCGAHIEFKGAIPNNALPDEIRSSQLFVLPSYYEGCPKVLLEAMACGIPCIGSNVEGINEVIVDRYNGVLCETDAASISGALSLLSQDANLAQKVGENARKSIEENYSLQKVIDLERHIYERMLH